MPARERRQNAFRASRPPRSAKVSPPRWIVSSPLFLSVWALSSQRTSGVTRPWRISESENAFSASTRVSPAAESRTAPRPSPSGSSPGSVAIDAGDLLELVAAGQVVLDDDELAFQLGRDLQRPGERTTRIVRFCLPAAIAVSSAWTTSTLPRNRWKFRRTSSAVPVLRGQRADRLDRGQGVGGAEGRVRALVGRPATDSPRSMSQVASDQRCWRQSRAISTIASSCSNDWTQMPVKQARTYSDKRSASVMDGLLVGVGDGV